MKTGILGPMFASSCTPSSFVRFSVNLDGVAVPRDEGHANGWDYATADMKAIQLFGTPCQQVMNGMSTVTFAYTCPPP